MNSDAASEGVRLQKVLAVRGFGSRRVVEDMIEGLDNWMDEKGFANLDEVVGRSIPAYSEWGNLDMNFETVAKIDPETCIGCNRCMVACHDGAHQCIHPSDPGVNAPIVDEDECVGCNLCQIVCPVPDCIQMVEVDNGWKPGSWNEHVNEGLQLRPKKGAH